MARRNEQFTLEDELLAAEEMGYSPITAALVDIAPGLTEGVEEGYASKELSQGRGAVTGRAFRTARIRSSMSPEDRARYATGLENGLSNNVPRRGPTQRGELDPSTPTEATTGPGSRVAEQFAYGVGLNALKSLGMLGATGLQMGASAGDIVGALPGAAAGAVRSGLMGPLGVGAEMMGMPGYAAGPLGALNTMGGLVGAEMAGDVAVNRERTDLEDVLGGSVPESVTQSAKSATQGKYGTGAIGMLTQGLISEIGDVTGLYDVASPIESGQLGAWKGAIQHIYNTEMKQQLSPEFRSDESTPGRLRSSLSRGIEAIGGYSSIAEAEEAGFRYVKDPRTGQISIEPPTISDWVENKRRQKEEEDEDDTGFGQEGGFDSGTAGGVAGIGGSPAGGFGRSGGFGGGTDTGWF